MGDSIAAAAAAVAIPMAQDEINAALQSASVLILVTVSLILNVYILITWLKNRSALKQAFKDQEFLTAIRAEVKSNHEWFQHDYKMQQLVWHYERLIASDGHEIETMADIRTRIKANPPEYLVLDGNFWDGQSTGPESIKVGEDIYIKMKSTDGEKAL